MCQKDTFPTIVSQTAEFYNKYMFNYLKTNSVILINERFNGRRLTDILGTLLAVMLLCIMAGKQTTTLQVMEAMADNQNISENIAENIIGNISWIPGSGVENRVLEFPGIMAGDKLNQLFLLPRMPDLNSVQEDQGSGSLVQDITNLPPEPAAVPDEPAVTFPEQPMTSEEPDLILDEPPAAPDTSQDPSIENTDTQEFLCGGFLCDSSGKIISCQNVSIIDGVLCLPFDTACTGIAADALTPLAPQIFEIYIPANIVSIDEGAFDGLTELFFIEVHPDNPVYGSSDGFLYKK